MRRPIFHPQPAPRRIRSCFLFRWIRFVGDQQFRIAGMQWSLTISLSIYPKVSEASTVGAVFVLGSRHMTTWHDMSTGTVVAETGGREPSTLRGDVERLPTSVSWWVIPLPSLKLTTRPWGWRLLLGPGLMVRGELSVSGRVFIDTCTYVLFSEGYFPN